MKANQMINNTQLAKVSSRLTSVNVATVLYDLPVENFTEGTINYAKQLMSPTYSIVSFL